jgi:hypothetical protein
MIKSCYECPHVTVQSISGNDMQVFHFCSKTDVLLEDENVCNEINEHCPLDKGVKND